jgi:Bromodomain extra-terminal - transcription regulation
MSEFTYEKKVKLRDKIEKMVKHKDDLAHVKKLLKTHNPDLCITKNNNGYIIDISNLTQQTYAEISKFINKIERKRKNISTDSEHKITNTCSDTPKYARIDDLTDTVTNKKLKYTNSETHLLSRVNYEKNLKEYQREGQHYYHNKKDKDKHKNNASKKIFKKQVHIE